MLCILSEPANFVSVDAQKAFVTYYSDEWEKFTERWAGYITCNYKHFGCTTTQRAESGHAVIKKGMFSLQPLDLSFDTIHSNLQNYERGYNDIQRKEKNEVDILVYSDPRLYHLTGKITHFSLVSLRCELLRDADDVTAPCKCQSRHCYDLPCCHVLSNLERIELRDIPTRWWIINPAELNFFEDSAITEDDLDISNENTKVINFTQEPWMKYIVNIESKFRSLKDDYKKIARLMNSLDNVMQSAESEEHLSVDEISLSLPKPENVRYPGRPKKISRLSAFKKDYVKGAAYRRNRMVYGKRIALNMSKKNRSKTKDKAVAKNTTTLSEELDEIDKKYNSFDFDINEVLKLSPNPDDVTKRSLYLSRKRKRGQNIIDNMLGKEKEYDSDDFSTSIEYHFPKLHSSIDRDNVKELFDPVGDGHCGYRSIAYLHYGNQERYKDVKRDMLVALEANRNAYEEYFDFNIPLIEKNIRSGLDEGSNSPIIWFKTPECSQVVADTYNIPVCVYSDSSNKSNFIECMTFLPLAMPVKAKKVRTYSIQNYSNVHWLAIKFGHLQMQFPTIQHMHFKVDPSYPSLFKKTWNNFGQFPKYKESKTFDPKEDELITIPSSDEE